MFRALLRYIDCFLALLLGIFLLPVLVGVWVFGLFFDVHPYYFQQRVGKDKVPFVLIKFRTMKLNTESMPTHLLNSHDVTAFGSFLRRTKIDELPQVWNVLRGEMSFVGPRPGLPNQHDLTAAREQLKVFSVRPGITGLAQVRGIDMSTPYELAAVDAEMIANLSLKNYFKYIILTVLGKGWGDKINPRL